MESFLLMILAWIILFIGAVAHEVDMYRNFKKTGNAKAWFFKIEK